MHALLIAEIIVFVLNAAGIFIEFNNRFVNALVDTVLFAIVFGALIHFGFAHGLFRYADPSRSTLDGVGVKDVSRSSRHASPH